jgi:hypothetical protein
MFVTFLTAIRLWPYHWVDDCTTVTNTILIRTVTDKSECVWYHVTSLLRNARGFPLCSKTKHLQWLQWSTESYFIWSLFVSFSAFLLFSQSLTLTYGYAGNCIENADSWIYQTLYICTDNKLHLQSPLPSPASPILTLQLTSHTKDIQLHLPNMSSLTYLEVWCLSLLCHLRFACVCSIIMLLHLIFPYYITCCLYIYFYWLSRSIKM